MGEKSGRFVEELRMEKGRLGSIIPFPIHRPPTSHGIFHYDIRANNFSRLHHEAIESCSPRNDRLDHCIDELSGIRFFT